jgi:SlyX protein
MSNTQSSNEVDQRLMDLEIKSSFSEDLLDQLNQIIVRQQQQIDFLIEQVSRLRHPAREGGEGPLRQLTDDLPPHY